MRKNPIIFILLFSLIFLLFFPGCQPSITPDLTGGTISGQAALPGSSSKDITGYTPIPGATITVIDAQGNTHTTLTDENGFYSFDNIAVKANTIIYITKDVIGDGKIVFMEVIPQALSQEESFYAGIADAESTALALAIEALVNLGLLQEEINLEEIISAPGFAQLEEAIRQAQGNNQDILTLSSIITQAQAIADYILNPPAPTPTPTPPSLSDAKAITAFDFKALAPDVVGVINEGAKTIALTVPFGTDVTALIPTIVHTGVSVSPASGAAQDFTSPVTYTVTAEDTSTQAYLVTVTVAAPVITTTSTIANGAAAPTVTVTGTNFKAGIVAADLTVGVGITGLTLGTVSFVSATEITVAFTGTAAAGDLTIQAKTSAFDPASVSVSNTLTVTVPAAVIDIAVIPGVTVPVAGATPVTTITETAQYTGTVTWSPVAATFVVSTVYTAWITLTPKAGYTLTGVAANFFTVAGVITDTNAADSGVVTAVFPETVLAVGDSYGGGIVAYILQSWDPGYYANVQHGLIAATADATSTMPWSNITDVLAGAAGVAIGTGQANTTAIVGQTGCTSGAAYYCENLTEGSYSDWYLPSRDELNEMYRNQDAIDGFADPGYWSSSEYGADHAWVQDFWDGSRGGFFKYNTARVRAVRAF